MARSSFAAWAVALTLAACGTPAAPPDEATTDPLAVPGGSDLTSLFTGALVEVDIGQGTFTVVNGQIERTFAYDEATVTVDVRDPSTAVVQGLAGSEGAQVAVRYAERASGFYAVRVEFE
jgi:hypothetical protein